MSAVMKNADRYREIEVVPAGAALGAEILGVRLPDATEAQFHEITRAFNEYSVLLFRSQNLTDPELIASGKRFGPLEMPGVSVIGKPYIEEFPEILVVSNLVDDKGNPLGNLGAAETSWHTDMSYREKPISAAMLHALEIPEHGGGHMFYASMFAAWESLPKSLAEKVAGKMLIHDETYNSAGQLRKGFSPVTDVREAPGARHPLVRTHLATGRKALFLGRRKNAYIVGFSLEESEDTLDRLWEHATSDSMTWGEWGLGDVLVWDNRCTLHQRAGFDPADRSVLHRVQVQGERPV
jgi:taurine dioxygenase